MELFDSLNNPRRNHLGKSDISYKKSASILTPASGFMNTYDFTLNPYSGCSFGCTYCYAAFFARSEELRSNWGHWVQVKENSLHLLAKWRKKSLNGKTIYISSVTDPYQPIEREVQITRALLVELLNYHPDVRVVIQTRSHLITRDIDVLRQFKYIQVNMTITTDSEKVRKVFEPLCTSNKSRMDAIRQVQEAGISACITMTPLLPIENVDEFAIELLSTGVKKFIVQPFHSEKGKFIASTRAPALELISQMNWTGERYNHIVEALRKRLPHLGIGKDGFKPI